MSDLTTLARTGLRFIIDTHIIDDTSEAVHRLHELAKQREIQISRSDRMMVEVREAPEEKRGDLASLAAVYDEYLGPAVLGHSLLEHSVIASEQDVGTIRRVFQVLFPQQDSANRRKQNLRDALHIQTAIRYARDAFVTRDRALLKADSRMRDAFNGFMILSPEDAVALVEERIRRRLKRVRLRGR